MSDSFWVRGRVPGGDLHILPKDEADNHHLENCWCSPDFEVEENEDGVRVDRAVLHRNQHGNTGQIKGEN